MSLQYSGGTYINRTFSPATRQDWVNSVTQAVSDAGWTTISGAPGSGSDVKFESAAANQGQKIRMRFLEPGSGTCAQVTMKNVPESITSQVFYANPTSTWRVIATKFHFFTFISGSGARITSRAFIAGGTIWSPTFMPYSSGDSLGFLTGSAAADTDATAKSSWRCSLRDYDVSNTAGRFTGLVLNSLLDKSSYASTLDCPSIACWQGGNHALGNNSYRWGDGTLPAYEPLLCFSLVGSGESKIYGQLYDALVMNEAWNSETSISYNGHTWLALTDQSTAGQASRNSLFLAVA